MLDVVFTPIAFVVGAVSGLWMGWLFYHIQGKVIAEERRFVRGQFERMKENYEILAQERRKRVGGMELPISGRGEAEALQTFEDSLSGLFPDDVVERIKERDARVKVRAQ